MKKELSALKPLFILLPLLVLGFVHPGGNSGRGGCCAPPFQVRFFRLHDDKITVC